MKATVVLWSAALAACVDGTPPPTEPAIAVVAHEPAIDERDVAIDRLPVIVFAEDIDPATAEGAVWIEDVPGRVVVDGALVAFVPDGDLPANASLELVVDATLATTAGQELRAPLRFPFTTRDTRRGWSTPVVLDGLSGEAASLVGGTLLAIESTQADGLRLLRRAPGASWEATALWRRQAYPQLSTSLVGGGLVSWQSGALVLGRPFDTADRPHEQLTIGTGTDHRQALAPSGRGLVAWLADDDPFDNQFDLVGRWYEPGVGFTERELIADDVAMAGPRALAVTRAGALVAENHADGHQRIWRRTPAGDWEQELDRTELIETPPAMAMHADGTAALVSVIGYARVGVRHRAPDGTWSGPLPVFDRDPGSPELVCGEARVLATARADFAVAWRCVRGTVEDPDEGYFLIRGVRDGWTDRVLVTDVSSFDTAGTIELGSDAAGRVVYAVVDEVGAHVTVDTGEATARAMTIPTAYVVNALDVSPSGVAVLTYTVVTEGSVRLVELR